MNNPKKFLNLALLILPLYFIGCEVTPIQAIDENLQATFVSAETANGFTEGEIDQTIDVNVTFKHPSPDIIIKAVEKIVIDNHTTEYIIKAKKSEKADVFDSVTVSYQIVEAGTHKLKFFYKIEEMDKHFLGDFEFAINQ